MEKTKIAVIFGGKSTEHEVSNISGTAVIKNLNKEKYEIYPIYINKKGEWFSYNEEVRNIDVFKMGEEPTKIQRIESINNYLSKMDVIFPVLHGLYGEDGTIQGMLEMLKIPYVGCKVLASSVCMDKVYSKIVFEKAKIKQAQYVLIKVENDNYIYVDDELNEKKMEISKIIEKIEAKIEYPMFVKPSNSGSSVGVMKTENKEELVKAIENAKEFDKEVLVEQGINGKEVECAVLGNEDVIASCVGEIQAADEFYSYDAKYNNKESRTNIPANIPEDISNKIRSQAIKVFKAIDGKGLSRVDFFIEKDTNEIYINEINTLPGFTDISMYPKLFEANGIEYRELLNKIIGLAKS